MSHCHLTLHQMGCERIKQVQRANTIHVSERHAEVSKSSRTKWGRRQGLTSSSSLIKSVKPDKESFASIAKGVCMIISWCLMLL